MSIAGAAQQNADLSLGISHLFIVTAPIQDLRHFQNQRLTESTRSGKKVPLVQAEV